MAKILTLEITTLRQLIFPWNMYYIYSKTHDYEKARKKSSVPRADVSCASARGHPGFALLRLTSHSFYIASLTKKLKRNEMFHTILLVIQRSSFSRPGSRTGR